MGFGTSLKIVKCGQALALLKVLRHPRLECRVVFLVVLKKWQQTENRGHNGPRGYLYSRCRNMFDSPSPIISSF